ncbi:alpha/beta fold hydrolase [Limibaculum sp. FT325]|uniref:alpha/beta fold hydrolase n=1 Tax=Thermohalobaculum sediminis TaxID=2939436 RepID=UPI0020BDEA1F|nr:alpha/beta fold hydrolase [Limibaculum sediminis]MCL5777594.1 alpha/beta fold hydrolase [Limibaculum sediminis]
MSTGQGGGTGGGAGGRMADLASRMARLGAQLARADLRAVEIATTPRDEIWREGKITLSRYRPVTAPRLGPLVILHGLIGRQTMTDLEPGRSLVQRLLAGGVDTYVVDWGNPTRADRFLDFTDYAEIFLGEVLAAVSRESGAARAALFGICQGGVFALCHAALHPQRLKGLALAVTPVDFHADVEDPEPGHGHLNLWTRNLDPDLIARMVDDWGNLPGELTGAVFQNLAPARTVSKYGADLLEIAGDDDAFETFLRMEKWLADRPDHPGAAAREWLVGLYAENRLVEGTFMVAGQPVRLGDIACPVLNIYGARDHIIPPPCSRALGRHLRHAPYREVEVPTGHIGVFVSRRAQAIVPPAVIEWLEGLD